MTPIGDHVLRELSVRSVRTDPLPLLAVSDELGAIQNELETVARTMEYFLAELGPIVPAEALPFLRISAAGLANQRTNPQELAERFRNAWGMMEVLGGDPRDRLLAAELLAATDVPIPTVYAHMMQTVDQLRALQPRCEEPVATATILHLYPNPTSSSRLSDWVRIRSSQNSPEAAALLAAQGDDRLQADQAYRSAFAADGNSDPDPSRAAAYLAVSGTVSGHAIAQMEELVKALRAIHIPSPWLTGALLLSRPGLSTPETVDWVLKAAEISKARHLGPTEAEQLAVAVAMVHGLPSGRFAGAAPPILSTGTTDRLGVPTLVALHAWIYRSILGDPEPSGTDASRGG
ncbi:MAG: hypothetical protein L3K03_04590 [Thermoplasmata archaeon]|nr:hypothetical protein [Thermoplasmata archaeon]